MRFIKYFLVAVLFLVTGIVYAREVPKIKLWLLNKIEVLSREKADLEVRAHSIDFKFFPPGVELHNLTITPRGDMANNISPTAVESLGIFLSPATLVAGRFEIGSIAINHPITNIFVRKNAPGVATPPQPENAEDFFSRFIGVPIRSVSVTHAEIRALIEPADLAIQLRDFGFQGEKTYKAAKADIFAPDVLAKKISVPDSLTGFGLATRIIAERNAVEIAAFKINLGANYLIAGGVARGDIATLNFPFVNGRTIAHLDVAASEKLARIFYPSLKIPDASGEVNLEVITHQDRGHEPHISGEIETKELKIDKFVIGGIQGRLNYADNVVTSKELKLENSAGQGVISDISVKIGKETRVSGRVGATKVELGQLLQNLDVNAPVKMDVVAQIPCEGTVMPNVRIECAGEANVSRFSVFTKNTKKTIVALNSARVAANLVIDDQKIVFPKALIRIGENTNGVANGQVDFDKGFAFYYHTDRLDFHDVANLADLKFNGFAEITGTTSGTGHVGVLDAHVNGTQFWFEDFGLGTPTFGIHYGEGYIRLTDINGTNGVTQYNGDAVALVDDDMGDHVVGLKSSHIHIPALDLQDLQSIFSRKVQLPFTLAGSGSADVEATGPFSLSKLTYTLKSRVKKGVVAGESFQDARFDLHGEKGHAFADEVALRKGDGTMVLTGDCMPDGSLNVLVTGRGLHLLDFEHIRAISTGLDGRLNYAMTLTDYILAPKTSLNGSITQTTLNQQILEDSDFNIGFSPRNMKFSGQFFNKRLTMNLVYPFKEHEPFEFKFDTVNWDFTSLLGITGKASITRDYETNLTAKADLTSREGGLWKSTGSINVQKFYVRHGTSQMKNAAPIDIRFDNGFVKVNQFRIEGDNTQINVTGTKNLQDTLNFNVNGRVDLSLLTFLTPFLRDMNGELSMSTQIGGTLDHPDLLGSAFLKKGFFKLEALPQPFEDVTSDVLFSQQRVIINRLNGHLGGGNLSAGGNITFKSFGDIPVEITGDLTGATLTVPENVTTHGDFHYVITGSWFPYLLKGDYNIDSGSFTKSFADDSTDAGLKRSAFLPTVILQKEFTPLEVDIYTHFHKSMHVLNSMMDAELRGDLEIKGDPEHSIFKGDVEAVPGGKVFFNETPFSISDCKVKFNNPSENNPNIYILAATHVRDWDVSLLMQGTKSKNKIELSSSPPLPERSIISLLAIGYTEEDELRNSQKQVFPTYGSGANLPPSVTGDTNQQQLTQAMTLLGQKAPGISDLKRSLGINVKFSNTVDETRNLVMPTVTAEKVWTPKVTTSVSRTIGDHVTKDVNIEYKLDRHFSLLGSYEGRDADYLTVASPAATQSTNLPTDIFGLDLQYQVEFK